MTDTTTQTALERYADDAAAQLNELSDLPVDDRATDAFKTHRILVASCHMYFTRHIGSIAALQTKIAKGYNVSGEFESFALSEAQVNVASYVLDLLMAPENESFEAGIRNAERYIMRQVMNFRQSRSTSVMANFTQSATAECWAEFGRTITKTH